MYVDKRLDGVQCAADPVPPQPHLPRQAPTYILDFVNHAEDVLAAFKVYYEGAFLREASDPNLVFDQWDKLAGAGMFDDVDVEACAKAYWGGGESKPSQGKLSAALSPVKDRFNSAYRVALQDHDTSEVDRLDTFRRDLRSDFVNAYDFLSAIVDYDDIDLEKRSLFARMLAEVLKDSQRHEPGIELSEVTLTHHALHKQAGSDLKLSEGDAGGLAATLAAGFADATRPTSFPGTKCWHRSTRCSRAMGCRTATRSLRSKRSCGRCLRTRTCVLGRRPTTSPTSSLGLTCGTRCRTSSSTPAICSRRDSSASLPTAHVRTSSRSWG